jgi:hypothetical protein
MALFRIAELVISEAGKFFSSYSLDLSISASIDSAAPGDSATVTQVSTASDSDFSCTTPAKKPKLLFKYSRPSTTTAASRQSPTTPLSEYHKYLAMCAELHAQQDEDGEELDCLSF